MSDRLEFHEVREGTIDNWESVCLCKTEDEAEQMVNVLLTHHNEDRYFGGDLKKYYVQHIEIVASVDLDVRDY